MKYPVIITQQGETIAVVYDQSGIELAVQEHYDDDTLQLFAAQGGVASFNTGLVCDLEEVVVYPATVKRKFRNTDLKVGDKVRVCMKPLKKDIYCDLAPEPQYEGRIATILEVDHAYSAADHDYDCYLDFGGANRDWIDTQYLEAVTV